MYTFDYIAQTNFLYVQIPKSNKTLIVMPIYKFG